MPRRSASVFRQATVAGELNSNQFSNDSLFILNTGEAAKLDEAGALVFMRSSWSDPRRTGRRAASIPLEVTKEAGTSPLFPIERIPGIDSGAGTQPAEKRMLGGIDHNPGMSTPDGQIAGLRICDSAEFINPCVKVGGGGVIIGVTGALINSVDEVRAIGFVMAGMQCGANNGQSLMPGQRPWRRLLVLTFLCRRGWDRQQAAQKE